MSGGRLDRFPVSDAARAQADRILQHLSHELRQPLSSIESIAYYLEMVLANAGEEVLDRCAELRRLVEESSWLLDNASLSMRVGEAEVASVPAAGILERLAAQMALREERNIELVVEPGVPEVMAPSSVAAQFFDHLLKFFRCVAQCADPLRVTLRREHGSVRLAIQANVGPQPGEFRKTLDPPPCGNGVRRFMEAAGGSLSFEQGEESLKAVLLFQPGEKPA
ncbi:MAG: HAMP domain-containing histidine kinase [Bryobacteraceae bacterium]|nr:HAMP domain-containing histidine kinase [Bryobacteraceae bacterium]